LLWGLGLYAAFGLMAALSTSFGMLLAARCLQGVAVASTRVAPISIVRDCYSGRRMAQVMSLSFIVFMAVPILAPTLGQTVILFASWRWIFGVLAIASFTVALWTTIKLPETLKPEDRREINFTETFEAFRIALRSGVGMGYTLFGFINSAPQVFDQALHRPERFTVTFATIAAFIALSSLVNARLVPRLGMRVMSHSALIGFITVSIVHAAVALTGHETLLTFAVLQSATMFSFGLMSGNFGALAMEPLGHVAGAAASAQGFISMVGGSVIGFLVGQQFDGSVVPITLGYVACGLIALGIVLVVEKGRLFAAHSGPPGAPLPGGH
jgi:DHA1 family bicyclomycin/chloramphenicol resistance-like MFS transporter